MHAAALCTGSKNPVQNRLKIRFVELLYFDENVRRVGVKSDTVSKVSHSIIWVVKFLPIESKIEFISRFKRFVVICE